VAEKEQDAEQKDAQTQHKQGPMLKHHTDFIVVALAETPRNEDLDAHGKAHRQGGEDEIIQACHHGGAQFVGAEVTEKGRISKSDNGLRQVSQHDGVCYAPDFLVGDSRFNHVTKLGISFGHQEYFSVFHALFVLYYQKNVILPLPKK
jgi:hypothetical protein